MQTFFCNFVKAAPKDLLPVEGMLDAATLEVQQQQISAGFGFPLSFFQRRREMVAAAATCESAVTELVAIGKRPSC